MVSYIITISYHDKNNSLQFETYRGIVTDKPTSALTRVLKRFHKDRRPIIFKIHRIVIEVETPLKIVPEGDK